MIEFSGDRKQDTLHRVNWAEDSRFLIADFNKFSGNIKSGKKAVQIILCSLKIRRSTWDTRNSERENGKNHKTLFLSIVEHKLGIRRKAANLMSG